MRNIELFLTIAIMICFLNIIIKNVTGFGVPIFLSLLILLAVIVIQFKLIIKYHKEIKSAYN